MLTLKLWQILRLTYIWCKNAGRSCGLPVDVAMEELEIGSSKTIVEWNHSAETSMSHFANHPVRLAGPGRVVKINKSLFARRKYEGGKNHASAVDFWWLGEGYQMWLPNPSCKKRCHNSAANSAVDTSRNPDFVRQVGYTYNDLANQGYDHGTINHTVFRRSCYRFTLMALKACGRNARRSLSLCMAQRIELWFLII